MAVRGNHAATRLSPVTKEGGLQALKEKGWVLVDATYEHVDRLTKESELDRDEVIVRDYEFLVADLERLMAGRSVPVILIKANVCRVLEPLLSDRGFKVLNAGASVYFPSNGRQTDFKKQFSVVSSAL
jgi:hypothetical protein